MPGDAATLRASITASGQGGLHAIGQTYVFGAGLGVTAAFASRASGLTTAAQAVSSESPPRPGNISFEPELRAAAAHDFGRLIHGQPRGVLKPASSADIASLMRWAKGQGVKVAARGQGHSTYGRALVEDGIVVDMSAMNSIRDIKPGSRRGRRRSDVAGFARRDIGARDSRRRC